jgi:hypothetical protein
VCFYILNNKGNTRHKVQQNSIYPIIYVFIFFYLNVKIYPPFYLLPLSLSLSLSLSGRFSPRLPGIETRLMKNTDILLFFFCFHNFRLFILFWKLCDGIDIYNTQPHPTQIKKTKGCSLVLSIAENAWIEISIFIPFKSKVTFFQVYLVKFKHRFWVYLAIFSRQFYVVLTKQTQSLNYLFSLYKKLLYEQYYT